MTIDRLEPSDDADHGVLSEAGSTDTMSLGIIDGTTAQVEIVFPAPQSDDEADADVVDEDDRVADPAVDPADD